MKKQKKIGWQKYEDAIKEQINSPFLKEILENVIDHTRENDDDTTLKDIELDNNLEEKFILPIPEGIIGEASLATSFDCWIGHTNFNITEDIKNKVNRVDGVEILKIHSRYRFFIGVGKMFEFSQVREDIEKAIL